MFSNVVEIGNLHVYVLTRVVVVCDLDHNVVVSGDFYGALCPSLYMRLIMIYYMCYDIFLIK